MTLFRDARQGQHGPAQLAGTHPSPDRHEDQPRNLKTMFTAHFRISAEFQPKWACFAQNNQNIVNGDPFGILRCFVFYF